MSTYAFFVDKYAHTFYIRNMEKTKPNTQANDFIDRMIWAMRWYEARGMRVTEMQAIRCTYKYTAAELRAKVAEATSMELSAMLQGGK